jgi:iron(III) transport system ATP-binding protein
MTNVNVEGLVVQYGKARILHEISFTAEQGEFVTLLGPSGCGKTTSLRSIAGLERPEAGNIFIGNKLVCGEGVFIPIRERNIGMVFQSYAIWPHMLVSDNVGFPLRIRNIPKNEKNQRIESALELVGLGSYGNRYPHELSGGQQQRVALARAIVYEPDVLLLDEPLSNLDAKLREQMRDEIRSLQQRLKLTTIYVTHDQAEAMTLSDKIIVMNKGHIEQVGTGVEIYHSPKTEFVRNFVGFVNEFSATVVSNDNLGSFQAETSFGILTIAEPPTIHFQSTDNIKLWLRPEDLLLSKAFAVDRLNVVSAKVIKSAFQGNWTEYWLDLNGLVVRAVGGQFEVFSVGEVIECQFPLDRIKVIFENVHVKKLFLSENEM